MKYTFADNPHKPGYVLVVNPHGQIVSEFWCEHALVICMMYDNMRKQNEHVANEFMYGHILGLTYGMLHAERYPRVTTVDHGNGHKTLRMVDPVLGEMLTGNTKEPTDGSNAIAQEILQKANGVTNDNNAG